MSDAIALARSRIGPSLRSLVLFGSCLSSLTRKPTSIPDLFAIVDDVDDTLVRLGVSELGRFAARFLPPITLALRDGHEAIAKLNLVEPNAVAEELSSLRDLYLAARFGKQVQVVFTRDQACTAEISTLIEQAATKMASVAIMARPRRVPLEQVIRRCVSVSYEAEPRPERPAKITALFDAFAAEYTERFTRLLTRVATERGLVVTRRQLIDERDDRVRRREARSLRWLLWRSSLRMMARWPKQMLVYRGWLPYLVQKLARAWLS